MSPAAPVVLHRPSTSPRWFGATQPLVTATKFGKPRLCTAPLSATSGTYSERPCAHASSAELGRTPSHPLLSAPCAASTAAVPASPTVATVLFPKRAPIEPLNSSPTP